MTFPLRAPLSLTFGVDVEAIVEVSKADFPHGVNALNVLAIIAKLVTDAGIPTAVYHDEGQPDPVPDYSFWNLARDGSIRLSPRPEGDDSSTELVDIEIISRVLPYTKESFLEVSRVMETIKGNFKLRVSHSTGLHVHVGNGNRGFPLDTLVNFCMFVVAFEDVLDSLHSDERLFGLGPQWTKRLSETAGFEDTPKIMQRIALINAEGTSLESLCSLMGSSGKKMAVIDLDNLISGYKNTIEFRGHASTLEIDGILCWVHLVTGIVQYCHRLPNHGFDDLLQRHVLHQNLDIFALMVYIGRSSLIEYYYDRVSYRDYRPHVDSSILSTSANDSNSSEDDSWKRNISVEASINQTLQKLKDFYESDPVSPKTIEEPDPGLVAVKIFDQGEPPGNLRGLMKKIHARQEKLDEELANQAEAATDSSTSGNAAIEGYEDPPIWSDSRSSEEASSTGTVIHHSPTADHPSEDGWPGDECSGEEFFAGKRSGDEFSSGELSSDEFSSGELSSDEFSSGELSSDEFSSGELSSDDGNPVGDCTEANAPDPTAHTSEDEASDSDSESDSSTEESSVPPFQTITHSPPRKSSSRPASGLLHSLVTTLNPFGSSAAAAEEETQTPRSILRNSNIFTPVERRKSVRFMGRGRKGTNPVSGVWETEVGGSGWDLEDRTGQAVAKKEEDKDKDSGNGMQKDEERKSGDGPAMASGDVFQDVDELFEGEHF